MDDLNFQRLMQSPYAAHLNFKTFENFFDVEICGEKEQTGKTTYKLKKLNPQKKFLTQQQQQLLLWMWQNKEQGKGENVESVNEEMILAEGCAKEMVRNHSQPQLAGRNVKTASLSKTVR